MKLSEITMSSELQLLMYPNVFVFPDIAKPVNKQTVDPEQDLDYDKAKFKKNKELKKVDVKEYNKKDSEQLKDSYKDDKNLGKLEWVLKMLNKELGVKKNES
jgi:hypothetical protein